MPSNIARKDKRKRPDGIPESDAKAEKLSNKKTKTQHGRKEVRTVTRTSRRPNRYEEEKSIAETPIEDESQGSEEDSEASDDEADADSGKAYNALLTLLKSDHPEQKSKKSKPAKKAVNESEEGSGEESDEEVAGAKFEEDTEETEKLTEEDILLDDDAENTINPFEVHFNQVEESYIDKQEKLLQSKVKWSMIKRTYPEVNYSILIQTPPGEQLGETKFKENLNEYNIKKRTLDPFNRLFPDLSKLDKILIDPMFSYQDVNFPCQTYKQDSYKRLYCLHILNHVYKTRDRILKNNEKLRTINEMIANGKLNPTEEPEFRDQGFTRPKILILLPTRNECYKIVEMLIKLCGCEQFENRKKFNKQFFEDSEPPKNKPDDFINNFKGNNNDFFCIGVKFTRKSMKLYSSFYSSDIIFASPIGLTMILENPDKKKQQSDFLSSIEVLIIDESNSIEMQNWDHILTVMKYVNKIPKEFHDADFSRIRMWSINDKASLIKQTLVFSNFLTPNINSLTTRSLNMSGKWKFKPIIDKENCAMKTIGLKIKQIFTKYQSESPMDDPETRFKYFTNSVLPSVTKTTSYEDGLLIYIPSYPDYLRIKNYLSKKTSIDFGSIDEYSSQSQLTKYRSLFQEGKLKVLLYTERLHHFRRFEINGVKNILMYSPPTNPIFYNEIIRNIGKSIFKDEADIDLSFIRVMFSKWDAISLERLIGMERTSILCNSTNEMFEFR